MIIRVGGESLPTDGFVGTPGRWYVWGFRPGETKVVYYEDPQGRRREWTDIRYWGYHAMTPGDYETNIGVTVTNYTKISANGWGLASFGGTRGNPGVGFRIRK